MPIPFSLSTSLILLITIVFDPLIHSTETNLDKSIQTPFDSHPCIRFPKHTDYPHPGTQFISHHSFPILKFFSRFVLNFLALLPHARLTLYISFLSTFPSCHIVHIFLRPPSSITTPRTVSKRNDPNLTPPTQITTIANKYASDIALPPTYNPQHLSRQRLCTRGLPHCVTSIPRLPSALR